MAAEHEDKTQQNATETTDDSQKTEEHAGEPSTLSKAEIDRAEKLGFSKEEIDALGDNLRTVLSATDRAMLNLSQTQGSDTNNGQNTQQNQQQQMDPMQLFGAKLDVPLDDLDENVQKAVQQINEHYANVLFSAAQAMGTLQDELHTERNRAAEQRFASMVGQLGDEWADVMKRPGEKDRLKTQYEQMKAMHRQAFRQELDDGEAFQRALGSLHFNHVRELERRKLTGQVNKRMQQSTERPKSRETEPQQSGLDAALQRVRAAKKAAL